MATKNIPRLVSRRVRDKTYHTWQPTKYVKRLGFAQESFGTDEDRAIRRSLELNAQVEAHGRAPRDRRHPDYPGAPDRLARDAER